MEILHLKYHKPTSVHEYGLWFPADHESQRLALMHFSGGDCGIAYHRLDEIVFAAGMHGWKASTTGDPAEASPENGKSPSDATDCSASSLLSEAKEHLYDASVCNRMGKPAHSVGYVRLAMEKLAKAEKALLGLPQNAGGMAAGADGPPMPGN